MGRKTEQKKPSQYHRDDINAVLPLCFIPPLRTKPHQARISHSRCNGRIPLYLLRFQYTAHRTNFTHIPGHCLAPADNSLRLFNALLFSARTLFLRVYFSTVCSVCQGGLRKFFNFFDIVSGCGAQSAKPPLRHHPSWLVLSYR